MSNVGKTVLKGHGLQYEGRRRYDADGTYNFYGEYARCACGLSWGPGQSTKVTQQLHREHKDALRGES